MMSMKRSVLISCNQARTKPNWKPYLSATTVAQKRNVTFILAATVIDAQYDMVLSKVSFVQVLYTYIGQSLLILFFFLYIDESLVGQCNFCLNNY